MRLQIENGKVRALRFYYDGGGPMRAYPSVLGVFTEVVINVFYIPWQKIARRTV